MQIIIVTVQYDEISFTTAEVEFERPILLLATHFLKIVVGHLS